MKSCGGYGAKRWVPPVSGLGGDKVPAASWAARQRAGAGPRG
jgi:hypothetical protein